MTLQEKRKFIEDNKAKLTEEEVNFFKFNFACVYTRNSISIEHGKKELPIGDIMDIVRGRPVSCNEDLKRSVYNHYCAYLDVVEAAEKGEAFTEDLLKNTHTTLTKGVNDLPGGLYRNVDISIKGSNHTPPSYIKVYDRMHKYFDAINNSNEDPVKLACYAHLQLAKIHPFLDGNGRLSRLMMNFILVKNGLLPISISVKKRLQYFTLLEEFKVNKNPQPFEEFIYGLLDAEYDRLMALINVKEQ